MVLGGFPGMNQYDHIHMASEHIHVGYGEHEEHEEHINVLAVCPGPMDTEFLSVAGISKGKSHTFDTLPRVNPTVMAEKSLLASQKGRAVYTNRLFYKFYRILAKLLPHSLVMKMAGT